MVHTKTVLRQCRSFLRRDFRRCTFNTMQPLVDGSVKLQSLFNHRDLEVIADLLTGGLKEITDLLVTKSRVQQWKRSVPHWNNNLEQERLKVKSLNTKAIETRDLEDIRAYKNAKNVHTGNISKFQKEKFRDNMSKVQKR